MPDDDVNHDLSRTPPVNAPMNVDPHDLSSTIKSKIWNSIQRSCSSNHLKSNVNKIYEVVSIFHWHFCISTVDQFDIFYKFEIYIFFVGTTPPPAPVFAAPSSLPKVPTSEHANYSVDQKWQIKFQNEFLTKFDDSMKFSKSWFFNRFTLFWRQLCPLFWRQNFNFYNEALTIINNLGDAK